MIIDKNSRIITRKNTKKSPPTLKKIKIIAKNY